MSEAVPTIAPAAGEEDGVILHHYKCEAGAGRKPQILGEDRVGETCHISRGQVGPLRVHRWGEETVSQSSQRHGGQYRPGSAPEDGREEHVAGAVLRRRYATLL
jgi:hypothetical protein